MRLGYRCLLVASGGLLCYCAATIVWAFGYIHRYGEITFIEPSRATLRGEIVGSMIFAVFGLLCLIIGVIGGKQIKRKGETTHE